MKKLKNILLGLLFAALTVSSFGQDATLVMHNGQRVYYESGGGGVVNMLSNGTFDDGTDWDFTAAQWSISSQTALFSDGTSSASITQADADMNGSISTNTNYTLTFDLSSAGTANITFYNETENVNYDGPNDYTTGSQVVYFKTAADVLGAGFSIYASESSSTADFTVDNVILKERELDAELITNGTFDTDTDWTYDPSWAIGSGVATFTDGSSGDIYQTDAGMQGSIEADTYYRLTFDISAGAAVAGFSIEATSGQTYVGATTYATDSYVIDFTTPSAIGDGGIYIDCSASSTTGNYTIDNITLKKWHVE
jgi:hypothetical protein